MPAPSRAHLGRGLSLGLVHFLDRRTNIGPTRISAQRHSTGTTTASSASLRSAFRTDPIAIAITAQTQAATASSDSDTIRVLSPIIPLPRQIGCEFGNRSEGALQANFFPVSFVLRKSGSDPNFGFCVSEKEIGV
jgi:hypothetical protein